MQPNTEIERACEWLTAALLPSQSVEREAFRDGVQAALLKHYEGHWYPDQAHRGCAFRSLSCCNGKLDPLLARVIKTLDIAPSHMLPKDFVLWVNPGEVKVDEGGVKSHIYCAGTKPNPYDKPKVRFVPTKLNVRVDENSSNSSSNSATPTGSPKLVAKQDRIGLSPSAHDFVPGASWQSSSQSSQTSDASDSEGEHDAPKSVRSSPPPPRNPPRNAIRPQMVTGSVANGMPANYDIFGARSGEPPLGAINRFVSAH